MASVVRGVLKAIKEKGVGGFFRGVRDEGYLYVEFSLLIYPSFFFQFLGYFFQIAKDLELYRSICFFRSDRDTVTVAPESSLDSSASLRKNR